MNDEKQVCCINLGRCSKADSREVFLQKDERPLYCSECGEELKVREKTRAEKLKQFVILVSIFIAITILPWLFVSSFFAKGPDINSPMLQPVRPADLQKNFIGTVHLKDNSIKTAWLKIYKLAGSSSQQTYSYTININATEARFDSLGLVIPKEQRIYMPDAGTLTYERSENNKVILRSVDPYAKPYWLFEEVN